jgi:multicomponent Na+:H+ antiporter subunit E
MHYLIILVSLFLFWLLLSGHGELLILGFGILSALIVTLVLRKMDRIDREIIAFTPGLRVISYFGWLLWQVVLSNIDVARRIWNPALPIRPCWQRLDTSVSTPLEKTLYANSITLTPGTLTTDVREDHFMIHSLTPEGIEELRKGEMEERIRRLGV